ncbi:DNA polymerase-3 subunit delta' [Acinetobacter calcoaceticus]|uniref:DNA-directed DNA polymerase n=1 Tax=Acinetobacter calcoaceticus TaxID=471 RepID=A0A4R1XP96_ACICA|nr:DNA polymerase-3 subunit delta' [Acinetobacter calcoaceticus]
MDISNAQRYPWQQQTWTTLTGRFPQIGHGLLFYGKKGCGKHAFAQLFVTWLLCTHKQGDAACGQCNSCLWLKSDTHPNYVYISTDEDNKKANAKIKIEKIRDLQPFVQQTVDGWRVVVIDPAEALNIASSNALLKTLEEPGERTIIILLAEHYLKLPATIRSRLQHFALDRIEPEMAREYLQSHLQSSGPAQTQLLLNLSNQMPLLALELVNSAWLGRRSEFASDWLKLVTEKNRPVYFASKWNKELNFADFITMFEYLLSDLLALKLQHSVKNTDLDLTALAEQYALENLFDIYDALQQGKRLLNQNVQSNLLLDEIFIRLMNVS